jgi:hypothetical protein
MFESKVLWKTSKFCPQTGIMFCNGIRAMLVENGKSPISESEELEN